ncbi:hypothetical protein HDU93_008974 [Gonapodya sp. JEL0774]|nr:hypothetical protein HDU93_008974 [Gonapodya sp. JEL0774]
MCDYNDLKDLKYTMATFHEVLRLYANVPFNFKVPTKDDILPGTKTKVYKGQRVAFHPYSMGHLTRIWGADAEELRPERWIDASGNLLKENQYKWPVFNAGPRICLGMNMANQEAMVLISTIVRKFEMELCNEGENLCSRMLFGSLTGQMSTSNRNRRNHSLQSPFYILSLQTTPKNGACGTPIQPNAKDGTISKVGEVEDEIVGRRSRGSELTEACSVFGFAFDFEHAPAATALALSVAALRMPLIMVPKLIGSALSVTLAVRKSMDFKIRPIAV